MRIPKDPLIDMQANMPLSTRASLAVKEVRLDKLFKQLLTVLSRDTAHLMIESKRGKLSMQESQSLAAYLKLVNSLKKEEMKELEAMTDEELEKLTARTGKENL